MGRFSVLEVVGEAGVVIDRTVFPSLGEVDVDYWRGGSPLLRVWAVRVRRLRQTEEEDSTDALSREIARLRGRLASIAASARTCEGEEWTGTAGFHFRLLAESAENALRE